MDKVSSKGIRDIEESDLYLYERLIDYKFDRGGYQDAIITVVRFSSVWTKDWEPDKPAAAVA